MHPSCYPQSSLYFVSWTQSCHIAGALLDAKHYTNTFGPDSGDSTVKFTPSNMDVSYMQKNV